MTSRHSVRSQALLFPSYGLRYLFQTKQNRVFTEYVWQIDNSENTEQHKLLPLHQGVLSDISQSASEDHLAKYQAAFLIVKINSS